MKKTKLKTKLFRSYAAYERWVKRGGPKRDGNPYPLIIMNPSFMVKIRCTE